MDKYIGRLLDNRYEILEIIGTGGQAVVYKARCHRLNRLVAIKILKDEYSQDEEFRRRFQAEGQAVAMLSHPNIVAVYDVSAIDGADYIVMELIDGISLKQYMEKKGVLNWKETLHFAMQIAKALEHAHSRGIVHRDIKPHNVMVLKNGSVKVADFGIARVMSKSNTLTKEALGSVHYISPEQAKGGRVDNRSDLYSLGVVMYEMMTGRPPYDGESPVAVAIQHINGGAPLPSALNPNIPAGMEQIIMKSMSVDVAGRYVSATAMLYDMDEFRKEPTILFDYRAGGMDDATMIRSTPLVPEKQAPREPKNTAERVAGAAAGAGGAGSRRRTDGQRKSNQESQHKSGQESPRRRKTEAERREENNSRAATIAIVACSAVAVIAIIIFLITLITGGLFNRDQKLKEVPNLLGEIYTEDLQNQYEGFEIVLWNSDYSDEYEKNEIMEQKPSGGEMVEDEKIYITVSLGEEVQVVMDDLVNVDQASAEKFLDDQGFKVLIRQENSEEFKPGFVIRTDPEKDAVLKPGQTVTLYVSLGVEVKTAKMPGVVGQNLDTALTVLGASGFKNVTPVLVESEEPEGQVLSQSVEKNVDTDVTTEIVLEVSKGTEVKKAKMPNVLGKQIETAQAVLGAAGFTQVTPVEVESNEEKGTVLSQSVKENQEVDVTVQIILEVSAGPEETEPQLVEKTIRLSWNYITEEKYVISIRQNGQKLPDYDDQLMEPNITATTVMLKGTGIQKYGLFINDELYGNFFVDFSDSGDDLVVEVKHE